MRIIFPDSPRKYGCWCNYRPNGTRSTLRSHHTREKNDVNVIDGNYIPEGSYIRKELWKLTKIYYFELLCASDGMLSRRSWMHLQSLAPTKSHYARVVGYGLFSLSVIHKEGLCPSSGDINRLMMM
jgi:hypothetical protein